MVVSKLISGDGGVLSVQEVQPLNILELEYNSFGQCQNIKQCVCWPELLQTVCVCWPELLQTVFYCCSCAWAAQLITAAFSTVVTEQLQNVNISCVTSVCLCGHVEETQLPPDISIKLYIDYSC